MTEPEHERAAEPRVRKPVERDPMNGLLRRERKARILPPNAACAFCGETNPLVLEVHHIAGHANDPEKTVVLCLNHHRAQSADQATVGIDLDSRHDRTLLDRMVAWLRGLGLFFTGLAKSCMEMADQLATFSVSLDAHCPAWRTIPPATT